MKTIPLTKGQVALVDDEDHAELSRFKWFATWDQRTRSFYAARRVGPHGSQKLIAMHNAIMQPGPGQEVDHVDHDTLDNRRSKLRIGTHKLNAANRRFPGGSSQFKGVSWSQQRRRWCAAIKIDGRAKNLGRFDSETDAAHAYDEAARAQWGEFAFLNFPDGDSGVG